MIRHLLFCAALSSFAVADAQTYFYIDQIAVVPQQPTTADDISIELVGGLSSTGAYVASASAQVTGSSVTITIAAADPGGLAVIVPHTETLSLGQLPAGTYAITFVAQNVGDFATEPEHQFVVAGDGSVCDSLQILSLQWQAFGDPAIVVHMVNQSTQLFSYPTFILFDADGDTLAVEPLTFFALPGESWHVLQIIDGATVPVGPFTGTLELWTLLPEQLSCSWTQTIDLCPQPPCATLIPIIQNLGGALTIGTYDWVIYNADLVPASAGQFEMNDSIQYDADTICLPPGSYTMGVYPNDPPTGGNPVYTLTTEGYITGPSQSVSWDVPVPLPFEFYLSCEDGGNAIHTPAMPNPLSIAQLGTMLRVERTDGKPLGNVDLFDAQGRLCYHNTEQTNTVLIPVAEFGSGVFIVRAGKEVERVVVLAY